MAPPHLHFIVLVAFVLTLVLAPPAATGQCQGGPGPCTVIGAGVLHDGAGGPLQTSHVYVITFGVQVPSGTTLTIQAGAIIKFIPHGSVDFPLKVSGRLVVQGTAQTPAVMTSHRDDSIGGDTNGDLGATSPTAGDWKGIEVHSWSGTPQPHQIQGLEIRFAGDSGAPCLLVETDDAALSGCIVRDGAGPALDLNRRRATVSGCSFINCTRPVVFMPINGVIGFTGNLASGNSLTNDLEVVFDGASFVNVIGMPTWSLVNTLNQTGVVIMKTSLQVGSGQALTLSAGMILKFTSTYYINVVGTLVCDGNQGQPVVLTSVNDNTGGQTGNGLPQPGSWAGIQFNSSMPGNLLRHTSVKYAGSGQFPGAVTIQSGLATLDHATIEWSANAGLAVINSLPVVTDCAFLNNQTPVTGVSPAGLSGFSNNTASGNAQGDVMGLASGTISASVTLGPQNALSPQGGFGTFVVGGSLTVAAAGTLQMLPGVVLKMAGPHSLNVDGTLTCAGTGTHPIVFTALGDAAWGTTIPGAPAPAPGAWGRIDLNTATSSLTHVLARYGGAGGVAAVDVSADVALSHTIVDRAQGRALTLNNVARPTVTACSFNNNGAPPVVNVPLAALSGFAQCSATNNTGGDYLAFGGATVSIAVALNPANTLNQSGVFVFGSTVTIAPSGAFTLQANTILKFAGAYDLVVLGLLDASAGGSVVTSLADDAYGGDTANDGPTSGSPGQWGQIQVLGTGSATLSQVRLRYGGSLSRPTLVANGASPTLNQVTIELGLGAGLSLANVALPAVTGCSFNNNAGPAITGATFQSVQGFANNLAANNAGGDVIVIADVGGGNPVVQPSMALNGTGTFIVRSHLNLSTLTLQAGVTLKVDGPYLFSVTGTLICNGAATGLVAITSFADDDHGGNTNGGGYSTGSPGDWQGLFFAAGSDTSILRHTLIRYAGAGNVPAVDVHQSDLTMDHVTIAKSLGDALDVNGSSAPTITDCTFICNGGIPVVGLTWATLANMSGTTVYANLGGDAAWITSSLVIGDLVIRPESYFGSCVVVTVTPAIVFPNRLSFEGPVVIKAQNSGVALPIGQGAFVRGDPNAKAVFTSINDNSIGGTTSQVPAQPGDWLGLEAHFALHAYDAVVRYAGANGHAGIEGGIQQGFGEIGRCRVERCAGDAFRMNSGEVFSCVAWNNSGDGFEGAVHYRWCTAAANAGRGFAGAPGSLAICIGCNSWANIAGNWPPLAATPWPAYGWRVFYGNGLVLGSCPIWLGGSPPAIGYCDTYGHANLDVDPLFVDLPGGDLRLQAASPLRNHVPLTEDIYGTGIPGIVYPYSTPTSGESVKDYDGHPRILDDDFDGPAPFRSDVGAHERSPMTLDVTGVPVLGTIVTFTVNGPSGIAVFGLGGGGGDLYLPPLGFLLAGPDPASLLILGALPTGAALPVPVPAIPSLAGLEVAVQAYAAPLAQSGAVLTNVWEARLRD